MAWLFLPEKTSLGLVHFSIALLFDLNIGKFFTFICEFGCNTKKGEQIHSSFFVKFTNTMYIPQHMQLFQILFSDRANTTVVC